MHMSFRGAFLASVAGLLVVLALACGGDKKDGASAGDYDASPGGAPAVQFVDLTESANNLRELESFRFDFSMKMKLGSVSGSGSSDDALGAAFAAALLGALGDIKAEGAFVAPDQIETKVSFGGEEISYVQIGSKAWIKEGGSWTATTADADLALGGSPSELFEDFLPQEVLRGARTKQESVNGVKATRYSFDKQALADLAEEFGSGAGAGDLDDISEASLDIWLAEDNIPVKVLVAIAGKDESGQSISIQLEMNVRDINSDSVKIRPPA